MNPSRKRETSSPRRSPRRKRLHKSIDYNETREEIDDRNKDSTIGESDLLQYDSSDTEESSSKQENHEVLLPNG